MSRTVLALCITALPLCAAQVWTVRVEEPTGLYRRTGEVVRVPIAQVGGRTGPFQVADAQGQQLPWQVACGDLLFPVSVIPGELPLYTISCCDAAPRQFPSQITARRVGMRRVELANSRFRVVIDIGVPAIVEAYNLSAGPQRVLNLVETTPEDPAALRNDIHVAQVSPVFAPGGGANVGWTALGGTGPITDVQLVETGPLRGRVLLKREDETWELVWTAGSPALRWTARRGFRFASVSASPFLPFDRCVDGSEYEWPSGPESSEPPSSQVAPREWKKLPGGHMVYYQKADNYGALGIVALDPNLVWQGACSRRFQAEWAGAETSLAITFPEWKGNDTVLEARRECRVLREPVLVRGPWRGLSVRRVETRLDAKTGLDTSVEAAGKSARATLSLDGEWELAWGEKGGGPGSEWRRVRVPGSVHTQWLAAPQYFMREANWISCKEWWYRKKFRGLAGQRVRLQFDATDYYADAYLNGAYLGRHEGYIDPYEYDIKLKPGENELRVRVWTPVTYYWRHRPYTIKGSYGAVDQKPDDITPLGITRSVRLVASGPSVIRDVAVDTRLKGDAAEVEVAVEADGPLDGYEWDLTLRPRNFASPEVYHLSGKGIRFVFHLDKPRLWWTWDHGQPNLYTLEVQLRNRGVADSRALAVGIREIEKIGWTFYLNRKRMFIRGTNYYYNLFLSAMARADYERDLRLILAMNVNMIRLHCHFTNPEFYDLADEKGVLIWQDYLEAWYPHDSDFSRRAAALYDAHLRYARNHPSVALWATSDEEDLENYRDLTKHLAARASLMDQQHRPVVRSTGRYGDAHVYHGWYEGSIWEYTRIEEEFVSELGATALPNYESLVKFLPNAWPIKDHADDWIFHKLQIPEAMRAWGDPGSMTLAEYIPRTQSYVARLFQIALERMRRLKYRPAGGILHFHAIDIWPSVTMAAIDFYRVPTKVFYTVQRSFAPVVASLEYDRDRWKEGETVRCGVWAINDHWYAIPGAAVNWQILGNSKKTMEKGSFAASFEADSAQKLGEVVWKAAGPGPYELAIQVRDRNGGLISENVFEFEITR